MNSAVKQIILEATQDYMRRRTDGRACYVVIDEKGRMSRSGPWFSVEARAEGWADTFILTLAFTVDGEVEVAEDAIGEADLAFPDDLGFPWPPEDEADAGDRCVVSKQSPRAALLDFIPAHCPNCGRKMPSTNSGRVDNFLAGACSECECGCFYALAEAKDLIAAADAFGSDLRRYYGGQP